jgi:hypothetical protein
LYENETGWRSTCGINSIIFIRIIFISIIRIIRIII